MILPTFYTICQKRDQTPNLLLSVQSPISWATLCHADKLSLPRQMFRGCILLHYLNVLKISGYFQKYRQTGCFICYMCFIAILLLWQCWSGLSSISFTVMKYSPEMQDSQMISPINLDNTQMTFCPEPSAPERRVLPKVLSKRNRIKNGWIFAIIIFRWQWPNSVFSYDISYTVETPYNCEDEANMLSPSM